MTDDPIDPPVSPADDPDLHTDDANVRTEVVHGCGHENVTAEHVSTFELTTDDWLTPAGDCILAVDADRTPRDFDPAFREACQDPDATITATITVDPAPGGGSLSATITGRGDPGLTLLDGRSMVGRTSGYTDDERTILVDADAAAADLDRDLVGALTNPDAKVTLELSVET
ncbi:DUF371 domain-containing protein [Halorubrum tibetense]|uniref:DUF371 domain-containing protein n=1 Tax=Halorubrum tibetense TaxID=175631 RepID=A0ABD5SBE8_9EURY